MIYQGNDYSALRKKIRAKLGQALEADVYDPYGVLLLGAGKIVQEEHWVPRLEGPDTEVGELKPIGGGRASAELAARRAELQANRYTESESFKQEIKSATLTKEEATRAVASVFERILRQEHLGVGILQAVVSGMISSLVTEPRALLSLALIKDADNYTHTHSVNVAILSICLAMRVRRTSAVDDIGVGGLVHDIGKVQMPTEILRKPGPLTDAEASVMRQHPSIGARLLSSVPDIGQTAVLCAGDHHESINGCGYPSGKRGMQISQDAQMISIADIYDALTTNRPYRPALLPEEALSLMTTKLADLFAPDLLNHFVNLVGFHPVGSTMKLVNGWGAVVIQNDASNPTTPALVQVVTAPDGSWVKECQFVDLRLNPHLLEDAASTKAVVDKAVPLVMREVHGFQAMA